MTKAFSVASWNIKHFKARPNERKDAQRVERVVKFLKESSEFSPPDIFGIYEVVGKDVYKTLTDLFPNYTFHITEGPQTQEILLGVRSDLSVFVTQRIEFNAGVKWMRPGLLATVKVDGIEYSILFLHLASLTKPRGWGLRDDMLYKAVKFRKAIAAAAVALGRDKTNYMFIGDLNTMGLDYSISRTVQRDVSAEEELARWDRRAETYYEMRRLTKTHDYSYWGGTKSKYPKGNLDHAYASKDLSFRQFNGSDVLVTGWVDQPSEQEQDRWIEDYSDHSLLYLEVQK